MDRPILVAGIAKLAVAGQQAGFTVEQMIGLLNAGLGVEGLIDLIAWRSGTAYASCSSRLRFWGCLNG